MHSSSSHAGITIANRFSDVDLVSIALRNDPLFGRARKVRRYAEDKLAFRGHRALPARPDLELQERLGPGHLLRAKLAPVSRPHGLRKFHGSDRRKQKERPCRFRITGG